MKTRMLSRIFTGTLLTFLLVVLLSTFGVITIPFLLGGGGIFAMAAGVAAETVDTENITDQSSELLTQTIDSQIVRIRPDRAPLDTILRNMKKSKTAKSWKYEFYSAEARPREDTIKTAYKTADPGTYSSTAGEHTLFVTTPSIWLVDDLMLLQGITNDDGDEIVVNVVARNASTYSVKVVALNGDGTGDYDLPDIAAGTKITNIGNGKSELDAQTSPYAPMPEKSWNYNQIHMAQIEEGMYAKLHEKEVQWDIMDYKTEAMIFMRGSMEYTSLFGVRKLLTDPEDSEQKYFSGGVTRYITETCEYTDGGFTDNKWIDWSKQIFAGNNGSDKRIGFIGSNLMAQVSKAASVQRQLQAGATEIVHGITFNRLVTNFGILLIRMHPGLDLAGWTKKGIVLDLNNVQKFNYLNMRTREIDLTGSGTKLANAYVIEEAFGVALKHPDTHRILEPAA